MFMSEGRSDYRSSVVGGLRWPWQVLAAAALLAVFVAFGALMILNADTSDSVWKNRIMIFSAFQALVFAAVGWLVGREVNRVPAEQARAEAQQAAQQAREYAEDATEARVRAATEETRGRALAAAITSTASSVNGAGLGSSLDRSNATQPQMAALATMAEELYGKR